VEERVVLMGKFRAMLGGLARLFVLLRRLIGPACSVRSEIVDLVGFRARLKFLKGTLPSEEWEEARIWHDGGSEKLSNAIKYTLVH
jgi:hypothetical protein